MPCLNVRIPIGAHREERQRRKKRQLTSLPPQEITFSTTQFKQSPIQTFPIVQQPRNNQERGFYLQVVLRFVVFSEGGHLCFLWGVDGGGVPDGTNGTENTRNNHVTSCALGDESSHLWSHDWFCKKHVNAVANINETCKKNEQGIGAQAGIASVRKERRGGEKEGARRRPFKEKNMGKRLVLHYRVHQSTSMLRHATE